MIHYYIDIVTDKAKSYISLLSKQMHGWVTYYIILMWAQFGLGFMS